MISSGQQPRDVCWKVDMAEKKTPGEGDASTAPGAPRNVADLVIPPFGPILIRERNRVGIRQQDLAELVGMHTSTVSRLEQGQAEPTWETVARIAACLGVPLERFLEEAPAVKRGRGRPRRATEEETPGSDPGE